MKGSKEIYLYSENFEENKEDKKKIIFLRHLIEKNSRLLDVVNAKAKVGKILQDMLQTDGEYIEKSSMGFYKEESKWRIDYLEEFKSYIKNLDLNSLPSEEEIVEGIRDIDERHQIKWRI